MLSCSRCKTAKSLDKFNKDSSKKRGYSSYCKSCKKERESETKQQIKARRKEYYKRNKDTILKQQKESRNRCSERIKKYEEQRRGSRKDYNRNLYLNNKEERIKRSLEWAKKNPGKKNAHNAKRRATRLNATPPWADLEAIKEFYKNCPEGYHVDHIVPLQHNLICGLHVLENLQYLTAEDNLSKSNKWEA